MNNSPFDNPDELPQEATIAAAVPIAGWAPPPPGTTWIAESESLPPLRLHHLFSLTAVVAVMLGINGPQQAAQMNAQNPFPRGWQSVLVASNVVYTIMLATAITIVAYGIAWRRRGVRFFHHPGHWLLVVIAVMSVLMWLFGLIYRIADSIWGITRSMATNIDWNLILILNGTMLVGVIASIAFHVYIAVKKCDETRWRWVFGVKAVAVIIRVLGDLVLIMFLLRAARVDRRTQTPRDFLHWYGVWLQIAICAYIVIATLMTIAMVVSGMYGR